MTMGDARRLDEIGYDLGFEFDFKEIHKHYGTYGVKSTPEIRRSPRQDRSSTDSAQQDAQENNELASGIVGFI